VQMYDQTSMRVKSIRRRVRQDEGETEEPISEKWLPTNDN